MHPDWKSTGQRGTRQESRPTPPTGGNRPADRLERACGHRGGRRRTPAGEEADAWAAGEADAWTAGEADAWAAGEADAWTAGEADAWTAGEADPWIGGGFRVGWEGR
ncbi:hypothetical protein [Streptomyces sp. NPDC003480]